MINWNIHTGTTIPVHPKHPVRVKWGDGQISDQVREANWYDWRQRNQSETIVAYQLHPVIPANFERWTDDGPIPVRGSVWVYLREGYSYFLGDASEGQWSHTDGNHDVIAYRDPQANT